MAPFGDFFALEEADWDHTWNCLVKSNVFLFRAALSTFNANSDGGLFPIMCILAGPIKNGSSMAYAVTRAAQLRLKRCLAQTQGPNIRVNAVCPGLVNTETSLTLDEERRDWSRGMATLDRLTTTEEVADTFVFLAANNAMTGERIRIDSGTSIV